MNTFQPAEQAHRPVSRTGQVADTRRRLAEAAHELFVARGFDDVTVDDIAAEAGTSRRTFFRHFVTKEAVVFPDDAVTQDLFRQGLIEETSGRPATMGNIKNLLLRLLPIYLANAKVMAERRRFIDQSPSLVAFEQAIFLGWRKTIAAAISGTLAKSDGGGEDAPSRDAQIAAGAIVGALGATFWSWYDDGLGDDLGGMGIATLERLERGLGAGILFSDDEGCGKGS